MYIYICIYIYFSSLSTHIKMLQPCTFNAAAELSPHRHGMLYEIQQSGVANLRCKQKMLDRKVKIKIPTLHDNNLT